MEDKIANSIALHQMTVNELKELKRAVDENLLDTTKFMIQTRHRIGYLETSTIKRKNKIDVSSRTMQLILDEAIRKEKELINKLIDMEIERKIKKL